MKLIGFSRAIDVSTPTERSSPTIWYVQTESSAKNSSAERLHAPVPPVQGTRAEKVPHAVIAIPTPAIALGFSHTQTRRWRRAISRLKAGEMDRIRWSRTQHM